MEDSPDEQRALQRLQQLKAAAEGLGHHFAARMTTPSGQEVFIASEEPDNIAAWILTDGQPSQASSPGTDFSSNPG